MQRRRRTPTLWAKTCTRERKKKKKRKIVGVPVWNIRGAVEGPQGRSAVWAGSE